MPTPESQYVRVARLAYALAQRTVPRYSHPKSPHTYTLPQRIACVLLSYYLNRSYRDTEQWLLAADSVRRALELEQVPDHTTRWRTFRGLSMARVRELLDQLLAALQPCEAAGAGDSTGYRFSNASAYFQTRRGQMMRDWFRGASAVGTTSQLILAACQAHGGSPSDKRFLGPLRRGAARYATAEWMFLADRGFDCTAVTSRDLIPPQRRFGHLKAPARRARADLVSQARLDGLYGQRWKCETVHSVIKRKFGDTIRSRLPRLQAREPILKAVIYNLHR